MPNARAYRTSEELISAAAAALSLGVDVATLRRWHARRAGPAVAAHPGGEPAYRGRDLEEWQNRLGRLPEAG